MTAHDAAIGLPTHYGVAVTYLGEDGEQMLAFVGDPRRALAAMNKQVREDCQERMTEQYDPTTLRLPWVLFQDSCGCEHADPDSCRADLNGPVTCCAPDSEDDADPAEDVVTQSRAADGPPRAGRDRRPGRGQQGAQGASGARIVGADAAAPAGGPPMTPAETQLDDAVRAIIAQEYPDAVAIGWVLVAATHEEGTEGNPMLIVPAPGQPSHSTIGLLHAALFEGVQA